eukprot:m.496506 g.496506  ORF g.496506 m.496506 type:complete len:277 (+) comp57305_c0_seq58:1613-2443(+)
MRTATRASDCTARILVYLQHCSCSTRISVAFSVNLSPVCPVQPVAQSWIVYSASFCQPFVHCIWRPGLPSNAMRSSKPICLFFWKYFPSSGSGTTTISRDLAACGNSSVRRDHSTDEALLELLTVFSVHALPLPAIHEALNRLQSCSTEPVRNEVIRPHWFSAFQFSSFAESVPASWLDLHRQQVHSDDAVRRPLSIRFLFIKLALESSQASTNHFGSLLAESSARTRDVLTSVIQHCLGANWSDILSFWPNAGAVLLLRFPHMLSFRSFFGLWIL